MNIRTDICLSILKIVVLEVFIGSIYAEYWWNYKIIAKHYAERHGSFGGCAAH